MPKEPIYVFSKLSYVSSSCSIYVKYSHIWWSTLIAYMWLTHICVAYMAECSKSIYVTYTYMRRIYASYMLCWLHIRNIYNGTYFHICHAYDFTYICHIYATYMTFFTGHCHTWPIWPMWTCRMSTCMAHIWHMYDIYGTYIVHTWCMPTNNTTHICDINNTCMSHI